MNQVVLATCVIFNLIIMLLGLKKYRETQAKAFIYIAAGFLMMGAFNLSVLNGWLVATETMLAAVSLGNILVIAGLLF